MITMATVEQEPVNSAPLRLFRGEGTHDDPSPYVNMGKPELAGIFWSQNREEAEEYAKFCRDGHLYQLDVKPGEAEGPYGTKWTVRDPSVRERRQKIAGVRTMAVVKQAADLVEAYKQGGTRSYGGVVMHAAEPDATTAVCGAPVYIWTKTPFKPSPIRNQCKKCRGKL